MEHGHIRPYYNLDFYEGIPGKYEYVIDWYRGNGKWCAATFYKTLHEVRKELDRQRHRILREQRRIKRVNP